MATLTNVVPSGSTDGNLIVVSGTTTGASVTIHTAGTGTSNYDLPVLRANNNSAASVLLTLEVGGDTTNVYEATIPPGAGGYVLFDRDLMLMNSDTIKAFAATASVVNIYGRIIRVTV